MFIPYLLYKKTTQCTFACVTLFDSCLFQTAVHSKLPGPVQIHNTIGTLEEKKEKNFCLMGFRRKIGARDFFFVAVQLDHQHAILISL